jgi:hypothetical protein
MNDDTETEMPTALLSEVTKSNRQNFPRLDAEQFLSTYQAIPGHVRGVWKELTEVVTAEDRGAELHAARESFEEYVRGLTAAMVEGVELGKKFLELGHPVGPTVASLERGLADLHAFRRSVFDRWTSEDDMYEVMSEQFQLSATQLQKLAERHPPPQWWYEDTDNPFEPATE